MRILTVIGTRPEAIKMAPVVKALEGDSRFESTLCDTGQHEDLLRPMLDVFGIVPAVNLAVMERNQSLNQLFAKLLAGIDGVIADCRPDLVLVHGDTSTAAAAALATFQRGLRIGHVEAGLRSGDLTQPWPEEMNRRLVDMLAGLLFAPTERARKALLAEGVPAGKIEVTGNTVVDALLMVAARIDADENLQTVLQKKFARFLTHPKLVLVTGHRRENFGPGLASICAAIRRIAERGDCSVVYPVHPNPNVREPVLRLLAEVPNVFIIEPLDYVGFVHLMRRADAILTDSGGIQEEAPTFGTPVLVMRNVTERPEAIEAGVATLVGTDSDRIVKAVHAALDVPRPGTPSAKPANPFGDGKAAARIVARLARG